ncbi:hypothetical protein ADL26_16720, partial [Thermoactinomyces vulgaris]
VGVHVVPLAGPVDHRLDAGGVAAAVAGEARPGRDVEAAAFAGGFGEDDDVPVPVGGGHVVAPVAAEDGAGRAAAVVDEDEQCRFRRDVVGDVEVHAEAGRVGAEVGDARQGGRRGGAGRQYH